WTVSMRAGARLTSNAADSVMGRLLRSKGKVLLPRAGTARGTRDRSPGQLQRRAGRTTRAFGGPERVGARNTLGASEGGPGRRRVWLGDGQEGPPVAGRLPWCGVWAPPAGAPGKGNEGGEDGGPRVKRSGRVRVRDGPRGGAGPRPRRANAGWATQRSQAFS